MASSHTPIAAGKTRRLASMPGQGRLVEDGAVLGEAAPCPHLCVICDSSAPPREAADRATEGAFAVHYGAATVGTSHTVGPLNQTYPCHRLYLRPSCVAAEVPRRTGVLIPVRSG